MNPSLENMDIADEIITVIERDYGRSIQRVSKFERSSIIRNAFDILAVFSDYRILEGQVLLKEEMGHLVIKVDGIYY